jgi:hypothetical protein
MDGYVAKPVTIAALAEVLSGVERGDAEEASAGAVADDELGRVPSTS